jgi:hypothetical protein
MQPAKPVPSGYNDDDSQSVGMMAWGGVAGLLSLSGLGVCDGDKGVKGGAWLQGLQQDGPDN